MNERETYNKIPSGIAPEGEELFEELFGISFKQAKDLATWEGEIGEYWREVFEYIYDYKGSSYTGTDQTEHG